jgi:hypothetical protein
LLDDLFEFETRPAKSEQRNKDGSQAKREQRTAARRTGRIRPDGEGGQPGAEGDRRPPGPDGAEPQIHAKSLQPERPLFQVYDCTDGSPRDSGGMKAADAGRPTCANVVTYG